MRAVHLIVLAAAVFKKSEDDLVQTEKLPDEQDEEKLEEGDGDAGVEDVKDLDSEATDTKSATDTATDTASATDKATGSAAGDTLTDAEATKAGAAPAAAEDGPDATDVAPTYAAATDVAATDAPATDAPATDVAATDAPATDAAATDVKAGSKHPLGIDDDEYGPSKDAAATDDAATYGASKDAAATATDAASTVTDGSQNTTKDKTTAFKTQIEKPLIALEGEIEELSTDPHLFTLLIGLSIFLLCVGFVAKKVFDKYVKIVGRRGGKEHLELGRPADRATPETWLMSNGSPQPYMSVGWTPRPEAMRL